MSDFLQTIRSGSMSNSGNHRDRRYQNNNNNNNNRPRRHYENNNNYNRSNQQDRKYRARNNNDTGVTEETMSSIKNLLASISDNQKSAMVISERRAAAEERKADAIERIAYYLSQFSGTEMPPVFKASTPSDESPLQTEAPVYEDPEPVYTETPYENDEPEADPIVSLSETETVEEVAMEKDDVMALILKMRDDGSTYNEIANHLSGLNLPTFSGRGKWHAQTIHRLCQQR